MSSTTTSNTIPSKVREVLWNYPYLLFIDNTSLFRIAYRLYLKSRPFSHFFSLILVSVLFLSVLFSDVRGFAPIDKSTFIEAIVVGVDEDGNLQKLHRINPLINTNIQLEKDLNELIYESLVKVDQNGEVIPVLADYITLDEGKLYQFKLKDNLFWHDGEPVKTEDVKATFELVQQLDANDRTSTIFSRSATKMEIRVIDEYSFEVKLKSVIPSFFEAMSFKILPSHLLGNINTKNITTADPLINRRPVGTGPYKLAVVTDNIINLEKNEYYREQLNIKKIEFGLYPDENSAIKALKSGRVHSLAGVSVDNLRVIQGLEHVDILKSNVIFNQYWGIYFNLGENGPEIFKEKKLRQAISSAINRDIVIDNLLGYGKEAKGPIPSSSFAYSTDTRTFNYDVEQAKKLLDQVGWVLPDGKEIREKDGVPLQFSLSHIDNIDREKIAEVIQQDLRLIGIDLELKNYPKQQLVDEQVIPRQFDTLLYGVHTFIDPDRYELFHSSQIMHPGLNISSYTSEEQVLTVVGTKTKQMPEVDDALDDARKIFDKKKRKKKYSVFLDIIADEVPVVFLYHPIETYVVNKRVKGINIDTLTSIEERFENISNWEIKLD